MKVDWFVRSAESKNDDLIELDESVPSVRQQVLTEQLGDLYRQPVRTNAFRGNRSRQGVVGIVNLLHQQGSAAGASQLTTRPAPPSHSADHDH